MATAMIAWTRLPSHVPTDRFFVVLDENLSNSQRLNLSVSRTHMTNNIPAAWLHGARSFTYDHDVTGSLQYNWVVSPTSILDVHLGFGVAKLYSDGVSGDGSAPDPSIDTTQWGFDPLVLNNPSRTTSQIPPVHWTYPIRLFQRRRLRI